MWNFKCMCVSWKQDGDRERRGLRGMGGEREENENTHNGKAGGKPFKGDEDVQQDQGRRDKAEELERHEYEKENPLHTNKP